MKQMKIIVAALCMVLMGTTFTSCLNSDSGPVTREDIVTVVDYYGSIYLKSDFYGYTYTPSNPNIFKHGQEYMERASIAFQFVEDEDFVEGKTQYKITVIGGRNLVAKKFCDRPDTLTNNPGVFLNELASFYQTDRYITVSFTQYITSKSYQASGNFIDLIAEKAEGSTLYVKMNQDEKIDYPNNDQRFLNLLSFTLPTRVELSNKFPNLQYLTGDSINMIIVADGPSSNPKLETKPVKIKIRN